ncbi:MAG: FMN-binding protein, partial [Clostridia bacterium]|nr:FMN-binding protein [Clostridia bacterium]
MKFSHLLVTTAILLVIAAVFGAAAFALNLYTGPIIEANNAGAANDRLNAVMPGGSAYEDITATLQGVPASVVKVSKETSGLGFVIEAQASSQYTGSTPMDIVLGVDATGKICGLELAAHSESLIFGADYPSTYIGKDSALADVGLYAGSTFSSTAFKTAVEEAMGVLIANNLIAAGVKSDAQILEELIPTLAPGYTKLVEATASGKIEKALKAENDTGFAYIMKDGDASYLALVNATGVCKIYDVEANDVTDAHAALADEAKAAS